MKNVKSVLKNLLTIVAIQLLFSASSLGQTKSSIAVANPNVVKLRTNSVIVAKMLRLELIKMDTYIVYDEFDMEDIYTVDSNYRDNCLSKTCLIRLGEDLNVDYMLTGSYDLLGEKIVISLKLIDVKNKRVVKSKVKEFDNQINELQRMTEITLKEMHEMEVQKEVADQLTYKNEVITSNNVGRIKNNGPRVGMGILTGDFVEFAQRPESQGGMDILPVMSMIGFQLEGQYVGTENFSGLIEGIFNVSGLEQGQFIPTLTIMNGFRFGKGGWEFAFGPGFGLKTESRGFFDTQGLFGNQGNYITQDEWNTYANRNYNDEASYPEYFDQGNFTAPKPSEFNSEYDVEQKNLDTRGKVALSTSFVFAFGRTFRAGNLNIPVNIFYSSKKDGGLIGVSLGFNVIKSKQNINGNRRRY
ncbi:MAG: hypothetical protein COA33_001215 [Fluviicola sp.]|nr:hypothetical protein [Fluviicola sp.]